MSKYYILLALSLDDQMSGKLYKFKKKNKFVVEKIHHGYWNIQIWIANCEGKKVNDFEKNYFSDS